MKTKFLRLTDVKLTVDFSSADHTLTVRIYSQFYKPRFEKNHSLDIHTQTEILLKS